MSKENTNNCLSVLKLSHLLLVFPPPGVFFVLDERRDMVFNPRERSECACAYFYSDPLFERKKLFAFIIVQSNEEGTTERALCCVVFFESSEEEKGKRPNNRPSVSKKAASSGKK